jgi:hypothetical protein
MGIALDIVPVGLVKLIFALALIPATEIDPPFILALFKKLAIPPPDVTKFSLNGPRESLLQTAWFKAPLVPKKLLVCAKVGA